eukprot:g30966.t1
MTPPQGQFQHFQTDRTLLASILARMSGVVEDGTSAEDLYSGIMDWVKNKSAEDAAATASLSPQKKDDEDSDDDLYKPASPLPAAAKQPSSKDSKAKIADSLNAFEEAAAEIATLTSVSKAAEAKEGKTQQEIDDDLRLRWNLLQKHGKKHVPDSEGGSNAVVGDFLVKVLLPEAESKLLGSDSLTFECKEEAQAGEIGDKLVKKVMQLRAPTMQLMDKELDLSQFALSTDKQHLLSWKSQLFGLTFGGGRTDLLGEVDHGVTKGKKSLTLHMVYCKPKPTTS